MDDNLETRWRARRPPFDAAFVAFDDLEPEALRGLLAEFVARLEAGRSHLALYQLEDWHEHDGFVCRAVVRSWKELAQNAATLDALWRASSDDWEVRSAWYPVDHSFYLRWMLLVDWLDDGGGPERPGGCLDVSGEREMVEQLIGVAEQCGCSPTTVEDAATYFDQAWGG
jgi:hypothetical protein